MKTTRKVAFADRLPYDRNDGFRTAPIAQPIRALGDFRGGLKDMARMDRSCVNQLFRDLQDWEDILKDSSLSDYPSLD